MTRDEGLLFYRQIIDKLYNHDEATRKLVIELMGGVWHPYIDEHGGRCGPEDTEPASMREEVFVTSEDELAAIEVVFVDEAKYPREEYEEPIRTFMRYKWKFRAEEGEAKIAAGSSDRHGVFASEEMILQKFLEETK